MGLTYFPNGVSSFGIPMTGNAPYFLPKDAKAHFVDKSGSDGNPDGTYEAPYLTIQQAVNQVAAGGAAGNPRGTIVYVGPGLYEEETRLMDRRYITLLGAGPGRTIIAGGNASGGGTSITLTGQPAITGHGIMIEARGVIVTGFTFRGVGSANGMHIGAGDKITAGSNFIASDVYVYGNTFHGDAWDGRWGIGVDGAQRVHIFDNTFLEWGLGGIHGGSSAQTTQYVNVFSNFFKSCRGFGVDLAAGSVIRGWCTGPNNVFEDDDTTALTNPARYAATGPGLNYYVGNYEACATELSALASDFHCGNYEGLAGGTMTHVSMA